MGNDLLPDWRNQFFPGQGSTDLVAAFVGVWVDSLLQVAEGIPKQERLPFFDGPFAVDILTTQKGFVNLGFLRDEKTVISKTVDIRQLLAHGHSVAHELLSLCKQRRWSSRDTETLAAWRGSLTPFVVFAAEKQKSEHGD